MRRMRLDECGDCLRVGCNNPFALDPSCMIDDANCCQLQRHVLAIKISFGCTGDFHVNMWVTSSSEEKLAGDPGNVIEATSIGGRRSDFFTAGKLAPGNFGLLQQYLP